MSIIKLKGNASGKQSKIVIKSKESNSLSLLKILRENGFGIASSCDGKGQCQKCIVKIDGEKALSCEFILETKTEINVEVDYL